MDSYSNIARHVGRPVSSAIDLSNGSFSYPDYQVRNYTEPMQHHIYASNFNHASNIQHELFNSSTSAVFMTPMSSQTHMPLHNHDGQYNNAYSADCFVPNTNNSIVLTSVSQNLGIYNRSVGFSSNMQQPFYQEVPCSTPPLAPIGIGVPCEPVPTVYSNVPPQHMSHAPPSLPELQSHTYAASVPQPNSLEPSQFYMNDNSVIERAEEDNTCSDSITLDDLSEDVQREIERELEEERQESLQRKLAGLQKTRNGIVKKVAA
jgi:hypothetical protein